jgi:hypothetical protein
MFEITVRETQLREKIGATFETGPVPPPTHCPDCRMQKQMAWRNERVLYRRKSGASGKEIISMYPEGTSFPVYERSEWWSDSWDPLSFGREFDFSCPFFEQFLALREVVPRPALQAVNVENCDYCNFALESRNSYLSHNCYRSESMLYCYWTMECKDCVDCSYLFQSQRCFDCADCNHSYGCVSCQLCHNCSDCFRSYDCRGCANCFGCVGLRQKSHCMFNEQLTKGEYEKRMKEFDVQDPSHVRTIEERVRSLRAKHPHLYSVQEKTENCTGDYIFEAKDCVECYQAYRIQDCVHVQDTDGCRDALDCYHPGWAEVLYNAYSPVRQRNTAFCCVCWDGSDVFYCDMCFSVNHCFGCVGLRHKKYCIFNRQYSKEDYEALLPRIVAHMKKTPAGRQEWGEFFPVTLSPIAYNESMAQQEFPLTKEEVLARGWRWRDDLPFTTGKETIGWEKIPERTEDLPDSITAEVLACIKCGRNYRIIPQELEFYRSARVRFPRECPECRYEARAALRNPRHLHKRACAKCGKEIETTYTPDNPAIVYCEKCYLETVY